MHNIEHYIYSEKTSKQKIEKELDAYVKRQTYQEGGHGTGGIRWIDHIVCKNYEDAEKYIKDHDKGWYDCLAVKYYKPCKVPDTAMMTQLKENTKEALDLYNRRSSVIYPKTLSASYISCKKCGSKLSKEYMRSNTCPLCHADLRPDHILKAIEAAKNKHSRCMEKEQEYIQKHSKKELSWLVKIEYHT